MKQKLVNPWKKYSLKEKLVKSHLRKTKGGKVSTVKSHLHKYPEAPKDTKLINKIDKGLEEKREELNRTRKEVSNKAKKELNCVL